MGYNFNLYVIWNSCLNHINKNKQKRFCESKKIPYLCKRKMDVSSSGSGQWFI